MVGNVIEPVWRRFATYRTALRKPCAKRPARNRHSRIPRTPSHLIQLYGNSGQLPAPPSKAEPAGYHHSSNGRMAHMTHRHAALFPVIAYNAWVDYCNTIARAWVDAFNPYR